MTFTHPSSNAKATGLRLSVGATLIPGDLYDSTTGTWSVCACPGLEVVNNAIIWLRNVELSPNAQRQLAQLNAFGGDLYAAMTFMSGWVLLPSPNWNGDPRVALGKVLHPECIEELVQFGYVLRSDHPALGQRAMSYGRRETLVLTEAGKREGLRLFKALND